MMNATGDTDQLGQCKSVEYELTANVNIEEENNDDKASERYETVDDQHLWSNANRYRGNNSVNNLIEGISRDRDIVESSPSMLPFTSLSRNRMFGYLDSGQNGDTSLLTSLSHHHHLTDPHFSEETLLSISSIGIPNRVHRFTSLCDLNNNDQRSKDEPRHSEDRRRTLSSWRKYYWSKISVKTSILFGRHKER